MAETICAVALDAATYAIDKLYSYRVPDELREQVQIGTRVLVPFGFGNKRAEAVVLAFREDAGEFKLKPIVEVLDETPILTAEQLRLAAWMRERLYCTYFDCVHAMLPAGLWFKRNETYTLAPDADLAALRERDGEAGQVLGMTRGQTFFHVILPQMAKRVLLPVSNEVITLVKDTSLAFSISYVEMFTIAKQIAAAKTTMVPFVAAGIFYYIFNFVVAWVMELLEKKFSYYH